MSFYEKNYSKLFYQGGASANASKFIQKSIETGLKSLHFSKVLEIGGGEGFHVPYVQHGFDEYYLTDIDVREPIPEVVKLASQKKLFQLLEDANLLSFSDNYFDRTIFMCVLHHLPNVENALLEAKRVTGDGGLISIYLPCDPGMLYRILRHLVLTRRAKELKIDYKLINAREHIGNVSAILHIIKHVFKDDLVKIRKFPFMLFGWNFNIFYNIQIRIQK